MTQSPTPSDLRTAGLNISLFAVDQYPPLLSIVEGVSLKDALLQIRALLVTASDLAWCLSSADPNRLHSSLLSLTVLLEIAKGIVVASNQGLAEAAENN